jgi:diaminopimelate dehydrogenase
VHDWRLLGDARSRLVLRWRMNLIFEPQFLNLIAKAPHRMDHRSTAPIRIAIVGHGNLGRGVEAAIARNPDMVLAGIYSRRDPAQLRPLQPGTPVHGMDSLLAHRAGIDVLVLCGGSKDDLPQQSPALAAHFSLVDSFDTHARIPGHFELVDAAARAAGTTALISAGWDPGMFSLQRLMGEALLPDGATYTFWGKGLSQGRAARAQRRAARTVCARAAPARVLCGAGAWGRCRRRAPGHHRHAALLRRVRHHGALHQRAGAGP